MATGIDAEAPHNNFDVRQFPLPSLLALPRHRQPPRKLASTASVLTCFVTDHLGVGFWQPD